MLKYMRRHLDTQSTVAMASTHRFARLLSLALVSCYFCLSAVSAAAGSVELTDVRDAIMRTKKEDVVVQLMYAAEDAKSRKVFMKAAKAFPRGILFTHSSESRIHSRAEVRGVRRSESKRSFRRLELSATWCGVMHCSEEAGVWVSVRDVGLNVDSCAAGSLLCLSCAGAG